MENFTQRNLYNDLEITPHCPESLVSWWSWGRILGLCWRIKATNHHHAGVSGTITDWPFSNHTQKLVLHPETSSTSRNDFHTQKRLGWILTENLDFEVIDVSAGRVDAEAGGRAAAHQTQSVSRRRHLGRVQHTERERAACKCKSSTIKVRGERVTQNSISFSLRVTGSLLTAKLTSSFSTTKICVNFQKGEYTFKVACYFRMWPSLNSSIRGLFLVESFYSRTPVENSYHQGKQSEPCCLALQVATVFFHPGIIICKLRVVQTGGKGNASEDGFSSDFAWINVLEEVQKNIFRFWLRTFLGWTIFSMHHWWIILQLSAQVTTRSCETWNVNFTIWRTSRKIEFRSVDLLPKIVHFADRIVTKV